MESSRVASSLHERTVDLDLVEREAAQIAQRRVTGAKIIQRDPDAEGAKLVQDRQRRLAVLQQHRFGNLQFETMRRKAGCLQRRLHRRHQIWLLN